jgi:DNA-3-methyladenine glycosylase II
MKQTAYCLFETPLGTCGIAWSKPGDSGKPLAVILFQLPEATRKLTEARIVRNSGAHQPSTPPTQIVAIIKRICKHLQGEGQDFRDITLDLGGVGSFAQQVYEAARRIPAGQTVTYGELAKAVNQPSAARGVGQALGKNPIPLIIPCHRVLAAGGKPGGFSAHGGQATKVRMLAIEGAAVGPLLTIRTETDLRRAAKRLRAIDPRLARCMAKPIEFTLRPEQSPYATLIEAIVHQQLSPKAASTIFGRVKALYPGSAIPEPGQLLNTPDRLLRGAGLSKIKAAALKDLAAKTLDGIVPSSEKIVALSDEDITRRLTSIYGVGRWTVEMMLIFNLGRMDVLPVDDLALRKSVAEILGLKEVPTPKQLNALGESWRPLRTVASLYLWNFIKPKEV